MTSKISAKKELAKSVAKLVEREDVECAPREKRSMKVLIESYLFCDLDGWEKQIATERTGMKETWLFTVQRMVWSRLSLFIDTRGFPLIMIGLDYIYTFNTIVPEAIRSSKTRSLLILDSHVAYVKFH